MTGFWILLGKELRIEARSRELLTGGLLLVLLVLVLSNLAWGDGPADVVAAGVLWIALVFGGTLSVSRSLHRERDRGTWEALALLPVDWGTLFLAKAAANLVVLVVLAAAALPLYALLFDFDLAPSIARLAVVLLLGLIGFSAAATFLATASAHGRAREILLPLLLFPLLIPLLMMGVQATRRVLDGATLGHVASELQLLAAFDIMFLALGWLMFDHLLGE